MTENRTGKESEKYYNVIPGYIYKDFPRKYVHPHASGNSGGIGIFVKSFFLMFRDFEYPFFFKCFMQFTYGHRYLITYISFHCSFINSHI